MGFHFPAVFSVMTIFLNGICCGNRAAHADTVHASEEAGKKGECEVHNIRDIVGANYTILMPIFRQKYIGGILKKLKQCAILRPKVFDSPGNR